MDLFFGFMIFFLDRELDGFLTCFHIAVFAFWNAYPSFIKKVIIWGMEVAKAHAGHLPPSVRNFLAWGANGKQKLLC